MNQTFTIYWGDRNAFQWNRNFTLVTSEEQYFKVLNDCNIKYGEDEIWIGENSAATISWFNCKDGRKYAIVAVSLVKMQDRTPIEVAGLLVHEATHLAQRMFKDIREESPSDEFYAYSTQNFAQELFGIFSTQVEYNGVQHVERRRNTSS